MRRMPTAVRLLRGAEHQSEFAYGSETKRFVQLSRSVVFPACEENEALQSVKTLSVCNQ
jgi:hypothetical protein